MVISRGGGSKGAQARTVASALASSFGWPLPVVTVRVPGLIRPSAAA